MSPELDIRPARPRTLTRRRLVIGGAGAVGVAAIGTAAWSVAPFRLKHELGLTPEPFVPDAPEGRVRVESVRSQAMRGEIGLFTAVPAGHGDGAGLPVVVVLHGSSATVEGFRGFGFGRFVTASVQRGAPPFVLVGTEDGPAGWVSDGNGDPQAMLRDELPGWLAERGYDAERRALWGWSRGGYGALRFGLADPSWSRATALFSPAVSLGDPALADLSPLAGLPLGLWCGDRDPFRDAVRDVVRRLPTEPEVVTFADGAHTRVFWNRHTLDAFAWLSGHLTASRDA
ncbi:alpha/beta hydrolase-fold protein [Nocardioides sp. MAHUQ-72]|uniref:alpha/beta hydrolase-fold protein n=1 Tax=unclassified Nocardioides TaxID=2615069 RepID=UPI003621F844